MACDKPKHIAPSTLELSPNIIVIGSPVICVPTYHKGVSYPKNILCTKIDGDVCKDGEQHNYIGFIKAIFGLKPSLTVCLLTSSTCERKVAMNIFSGRNIAVAIPRLVCHSRICIVGVRSVMANFGGEYDML
jgi:hypothetical protein